MGIFVISYETKALYSDIFFFYALIRYIFLTKTTASQNEVERNYHRVRGL